MASQSPIQVIATGEGLVLHLPKNNFPIHSSFDKNVTQNQTTSFDEPNQTPTKKRAEKISINDIIRYKEMKGENSTETVKREDSLNYLKTKITQILKFYSIPLEFISKKCNIPHLALQNWLKEECSLPGDQEQEIKQWAIEKMNAMPLPDLIQCFSYDSTSSHSERTLNHTEGEDGEKDSNIPAIAISQRPPGSSYTAPHSKYDHLIYVPVNLQWQGLKIKDEFLWSRDNTNIYEMKCFGLNLLNDILGAKLSGYSPPQIESFCNSVAFIITQEQWIYELVHSNKTITSGILGSGFGLENEHLIRIDLEYKDKDYNISESFDWDISNPCNNPEEFAAILTEENNMPEIYIPKIGYLIRHQIQIYLLKNFNHLYKSISNSIFKSQNKSEFKQNEGFNSSNLMSLFPELKEDWNSTPTLLSTQLVDALGPLPPFKNSTPEDITHFPKELKNKVKPKEVKEPAPVQSNKVSNLANITLNTQQLQWIKNSNIIGGGFGLGGPNGIDLNLMDVPRTNNSNAAGLEFENQLASISCEDEQKKKNIKLLPKKISTNTHEIIHANVPVAPPPSVLPITADPQKQEEFSIKVHLKQQVPNSNNIINQNSMMPTAPMLITPIQFTPVNNLRHPPVERFDSAKPLQNIPEMPLNNKLNPSNRIVIDNLIALPQKEMVPLLRTRKRTQPERAAAPKSLDPERNGNMSLRGKPQLQKQPIGLKTNYKNSDINLVINKQNWTVEFMNNSQINKIKKRNANSTKSKKNNGLIGDSEYLPKSFKEPEYNSYNGLDHLQSFSSNGNAMNGHISRSQFEESDENGINEKMDEDGILSEEEEYSAYDDILVNDNNSNTKITIDMTKLLQEAPFSSN